MKTVARRGLLTGTKTLTSRLRKPKPTHLKIERLEERMVLSTWLGQIGGAGDDQIVDPLVDSSGNTYITGSFQGTADFDPDPTISEIRTSASATDNFIAKYDAAGAFEWVHTFTSDLSLAIPATAMDSLEGAIYVSGTFQGALGVDGGGSVLVGGGVFVLKLAADTGDIMWAKAISGNVGVGDIAVADGHVYLAGRFWRTIDFDPGPGNTSLTATDTAKNGSKPDLYVLTLDDSSGNGAFQNVWKLGSKNDKEAQQIVVDGGYIYLQGIFWGALDFNPGSATNSRTSNGGSDIFMAKYDTTGVYQWAVNIGGAENHGGSHEIATDSDSVYLKTFVQDKYNNRGQNIAAIDFDPGPGTQILSSGNEYADIVVAKYTKSDGRYQWAKKFGGDGNEQSCCRSNIIFSEGMLYLGGSFSSYADFNPGLDGGELTSVDGSIDGFILKLNSDGNYQQVWQIGGPDSASAKPIRTIGSTLYVTGQFRGPATTFPTGGPLTSAGSRDIFLMALDLAPAALAAAQSSTTSLANDLALLSLLTDADGVTTKKRL